MLIELYMLLTQNTTSQFSPLNFCSVSIYTAQVRIKTYLNFLPYVLYLSLQENYIAIDEVRKRKNPDLQNFFYYFLGSAMQSTTAMLLARLRYLGSSINLIYL